MPRPIVHQALFVPLNRLSASAIERPSRHVPVRGTDSVPSEKPESYCDFFGTLDLLEIEKEPTDPRKLCALRSGALAAQKA